MCIGGYAALLQKCQFFWKNCQVCMSAVAHIMLDKRYSSSCTLSLLSQCKCICWPEGLELFCTYVPWLMLYFKENFWFLYIWLMILKDLNTKKWQKNEEIILKHWFWLLERWLVSIKEERGSLSYEEEIFELESEEMMKKWQEKTEIYCKY